MSFMVVSPEQRAALACASGPARTPAEARVMAQLAADEGLVGSAGAWRAVALEAELEDTSATAAGRFAGRHTSALRVVPAPRGAGSG